MRPVAARSGNLKQDTTKQIQKSCFRSQQEIIEQDPFCELLILKEFLCFEAFQ